jgi:hypothetical protein
MRLALWPGSWSDAYGLGSMAELWDGRSDLDHFTSALRYPVFVNGGNYSGQPSMTATPILRELLDTCLESDLDTARPKGDPGV